MLQCSRVMIMYKIKAENAAEIRRAMRQAKGSVYNRMQAVAMRGEGRNNTEISNATGFNPNYICEIVKDYLKGGIEKLMEDGRKGGNNRNLSEEEEVALIAKFADRAEKGKVVTVEEIALAYDKACNKTHKSKSCVYYLLHKHGWRRVTPKKRHPKKASEAQIDILKKT